MITAAVVSSFCELRMREASRSSSSSPLEATSGIRLTPVSNPDRPSANSGNAAIANHTSPPKPPPTVVRALSQLDSASGVLNTSAKPTLTTIALTDRNKATTGIAMPTASLKPRRKTAPRISSSTTVISTSLPCRNPGKAGFSTMCTDASDADKVIVTIQAVATKPSSTRTNTLPRQKGSNFSRIATDPWP